MEENSFHQPENQFSSVNVLYFFKNWSNMQYICNIYIHIYMYIYIYIQIYIYIPVSMKVSTSRKNSEQKKPLHQSENLFPLVGIKDFFEIQYSAFWKLRLIGAIFGQTHYQNQGKTVFKERPYFRPSGKSIFWSVLFQFSFYSFPPYQINTIQKLLF